MLPAASRRTRLRLPPASTPSIDVACHVASAPLLGAVGCASRARGHQRKLAPSQRRPWRLPQPPTPRSGRAASRHREGNEGVGARGHEHLRTSASGAEVDGGHGSEARSDGLDERRRLAGDVSALQFAIEKAADQQRVVVEGQQ